MKHIVLLLSTIIFLADGQLLNDHAGKHIPDLHLTIRIKEEKICSGESFSVVSRLENISNRDVIIDTRFIRRYGVDIAHDQSSSNFFDIPKMRTGFGDSFKDEEIPEDYLLKLKPQKFFEEIHIINPNKDNFFKLAGRYSIKTGYGQFGDWSVKGVKVFVGRVDSNELKFEILDCKK